MPHLLAVLFVVLLAGATKGAEAESGKPTTIVFVCLHGSVKSQVAAAYFNRIARERGLPVVAVSRGIAVDNEIPTVIREGLAVDGLAPDGEVPIRLTLEEAAAATKVFAFDEVPADLRGTAEVTYWSDVPPATKDYSAARRAIVRRLEEAIGPLMPKD
jgi:protein-tyrosine-phosphatase